MKMTMPSAVCEILTRLEQSGFTAWLVGGCVRDSLLGQTPKDWDIATSALPEQVMALFADHRVAETGLPHGTVTVILDQMPVEVTTYRIDGGYQDGRHPDHVVFTDDIHRDLKRRDFTINAFAYHPARGVLDDFGGKVDLDRRVIRAVGDPTTRMQEDALRILRGLRFAATLDCTVDPDTAHAFATQKERLGNIAPERIREELTKLLCGKAVGRVLTDYADILAVVIPEITPMIGFDQQNPHHHLDVWLHTLAALQESPSDPILRLALLFHDIGKPSQFSVDEKGVGHFYGHPAISEQIAESVLTRLRFDRRTIDAVTSLVRWHDSDILPEAKSVKRWLNRLGETGLRQLLAVKWADRGATAYRYENRSVLTLVEQKMEEILRQGSCFTRAGLAIDGNDLLALGVAAGPALGELLDQLLSEVIDEKLPNRADLLLRRAKEILVQ